MGNTRIGRPIDFLSSDNPDSFEKIPKKFVADNFKHYRGNSLYDHQHGAKIPGDDDDWDEIMLKNFSMEEYKEWKQNLTEEKYEALSKLVAYENKQKIAKKMIEALPKDKRNYLHIKLKKNPGHYSQTLLKEIDGEKYDEATWMQKMYNNEPDWHIRED